MGRVTVWCCAVGLTGCAQLFGIDNTSAPPDVALPPRATLTVERLSIGATVSRSPLDVTGQTATYYVPDDVETSGLRRIPATVVGGSWSAEVPDGVAASVEFTLPDSGSFKRLLAFPNRDLKFAQTMYEHPGLEPAPAGGVFNVSLTLVSGWTSTQLLRLFAVGPWTYRNLSTELPAPDVGNTAVAPVDVPYDDAHWRPGVVTRTTPKLTSVDRLVAVRYAATDLIEAGEVAPFTQTGGTDAVSATLATVTHAPLDVAVDPMAIATRLGMTTPTGTGSQLGWAVNAAPGADETIDLGIQLNAGSLPATDGMTTITSGFGNPFTGWPSLFTWVATRTRNYMPANETISIGLFCGLNQYFKPAAGAKVDLPVPLPVLVLVNGTPLTSDGLTVSIDPNKAVKLSMVADKPGADVYIYDIHEVVPDDPTTPTRLVLNAIYSALGPSTDITIPAGVLQTSKRYSIRAHTLKGSFPLVSMGDLSQRDLPLSMGYLDSGVFTVAAP